VKVNGQYQWDILLSQQMSDAITHITDDIFFFQEDGALAHMHCACNTVQRTAAALSTSFLLNHAPQQPGAERIDYNI